ncbi:hypothetical protein SSX86_007277 [Deinandra increscens subsp. villosa]|uniref:TF-B3 domain-containing protein n=1 Tax=Deinandra increscens subsp. villosa TaxID=3103831 RepID=A0AAP0DP55_9ASTR
MAPQRSPAFFKILLDASAPHLPLPPDFVTRHLENRIPKHPMIRSVIGGFSWRIKIMKIGESCCFSGGWSSVVEDLQLGFGDFLIFRLVDRSVFDMIVFSPNGCEKDLPSQIDDEIDDDEEKEEDLVVDDDDEEDEKFGDEDEDEDEFEEDEDGEEDEEVEYDEEKENGEEDDGDGDGDGDDEVDGGIDGDDGDPFFMLTISKSHKNYMRLPTEFVELTGIYGEGTLTLKNLDGDEWEAGLRLENRKRYCISAGWPDFRRSNDLCDGDECVFKFIKSEEKLLLARVTKKRRPARETGVKRSKQKSGESPAKKVEKRETKSPARGFGVKRNKGQQPNSGESPGKKVEKRERVLPTREASVKRNKQNSGESPAKKVEKRERELPAREVKRNRGKHEQNSGAVSEKKVERRGAAREEGGGDVEVAKRPRGRPARR